MTTCWTYKLLNPKEVLVTCNNKTDRDDLISGFKKTLVMRAYKYIVVGDKSFKMKSRSKAAIKILVGALAQADKQVNG